MDTGREPSEEGRSCTGLRAEAPSRWTNRWRAFLGQGVGEVVGGREGKSIFKKNDVIGANQRLEGHV